MQRKFPAGSRFDLKSCLAFFRKRSGLLERDSLFLPVQRGGDEKIDVKRIRLRSMRVSAEINRIAILGVVLNACARAAPEGIKRCAEQFDVTWPCGLKVSYHAGIGILRSKDGIVERLFVIVPISRCRISQKKRSRQAEHIVAAAGLHGLGGGKVARELIDWEKVLVVSIAAGRERARAGDSLPEKFRRRMILRLASQLKEALEPHDFGNLRVGMQTVQIIVAFR